MSAKDIEFIHTYFNQLAEALVLKKHKNVVDSLKVFDVFQSRQFKLWQIEYILRHHKVEANPSVLEAAPKALESPNKQTIPFKNIANELQNANKKLAQGTIAVKSHYDGRSKSSCEMALNKLKIHAKKKRLTEEDAFDQIFGKKFDFISQEEFKTSISNLNLKISESLIDDLFKYLDYLMIERVNKIQFTIALKKHQLPPSYDIDQLSEGQQQKKVETVPSQRQEFKQAKKKRSKILSPENIKTQQSVFLKVYLYLLSHPKITRVQSLFENAEEVKLKNGQKGVSTNDFKQILITDTKCSLQDATKYSNFLQEKASKAVNLEQFIHQFNSYKDINVQYVLEKVREFVIETGNNILSLMMQCDFDSNMLITFQQFEKLICQRLSTRITQDQAMRLGQTVMSQDNKINYSKLAQNLQNYSRSKSGVEVTDQHYQNYERIRKGLKRKRMSPFKFFSKKELDEPSRQPLTIDLQTFKRYLENLCQIENFESFIQPLKNGRQINFIKFCHKIGYLAIDQFEASSPMKRAGASIDLNKSNLFGASQNFANRQELKRNFYSELYKRIKSQGIDLDNLFTADDTRDTGVTSKVLFVKRIQTTMYMKDTQSLFKADTIGFISEQFRVEKSDKIAYRGFIKRVREREAQILTIYGFFQQFYKTMVGKNYTQLYDIFKDYDNSKQRSQRKFNEKQIGKLLTENKIQFSKRDVQVFVLEFRIPDTTYAQFQKIENSFLQWSKMVGKVIKTVRRSPKQIVKDYFQKLSEVLQNQNTTIKRLFNSKVYISGYQMLQKVVSFPSQDCQTLVEQFDTQGRKQASLAEIIRKYNIHFGIKNDTTQQVLKKQLIVKAMDFICRLCLKEGIIIKDIFKPYELKNSPGKCSRMDFTNVLQNKLKLKKEASIETIQYIITDSQQNVGISVEDFQNKVYKRAYASQNQQKLYAKINRAVSKNKINLQSQFKKFQLQEGFIQESALVELVSTFNLKLQKQDIQLLIQNVQKNRSGNAYNWRSINLLIYIQSQKPMSKQEKKQSSRQKTMRFLSAFLDEAKGNRGKNDIGMVIQDYYQKNYKKGFTMNPLCNFLADISQIKIDRIQTLIKRYKSPKNDQISDQFFQDVRNFEKGNFDKDEQDRLKDSMARADTIQVDYRKILEAITSHTVKNSLSIYGAFNAVDKKKTGTVKSQNEFAKCLQSFVPPNVKIQELKQLGKKYAKGKQIDYHQFFADFNALKQIFHSQNPHQTFFVDKSPLPTFDEESKMRTEFQFPNSPQGPPPQQSQEFRRIFSQLSKYSMNQGIGLEELFRKFIIPKTKVFPRRQLEQYMERQGNYTDQMIGQFIQHIEETQGSNIDRGNIDFLNFFCRVYAIKSPAEQTEKFFRKMKDHLSQQARNFYDLFIKNLGGIKVTPDGRFYYKELFQKLGLEDQEYNDPRNDQINKAKTYKKQQNVQKAIITQAGWIVDDNIDIQQVLGKRVNANGRIGQNQFLMFLQKDLNCESAKPAQALEYIIYISGNENDRFIKPVAVIDTMKRLNPKFADYINRLKAGPSQFDLGRNQGTRGGPKPTNISTFHSEQAMRQIYENLIDFLEKKGITFIQFTQGQTSGRITKAKLTKWLRKINFPVSDDQIDCLTSSLQDHRNPNQLKVFELKRRIFQYRHDFFGSREINTESDAKTKMDTWTQEQTQIMVKFVEHILSKNWTVQDAIIKMMKRVSQEEIVGLIDKQTFIKGMNALDFMVGSQAIRSSIFQKMDLKKNSVITEHTLINFMNASRNSYKNAGMNRQIDFKDDIRQELKKVFDCASHQNHSNQINLSQFKRALESIGIFMKDYQVKDKMGPTQKISEQQFYNHMEPLIMKQLEDQERSYERMRQLFQQADKDHNKQLSEQQFASVLKDKFNVDMNAMEIRQFLREIDINSDGLIDIDEFIAFMQTADINDQLSEKAKNALLLIRQSCAFSPHSYVRTFLHTPQNFIKSFFAQEYKKCRVYPASVFKPQKDPATLIYTDLLINKALKDDGVGVKITSNKTYNQVYKGTKLRPLRTIYGATISLSSAIQVPNFDNVQELQKIKKRVVKIGILENQQFVGNTTFVPANWNPKYPYTWKFNTSSTGSLNPIIYRSMQNAHRQRQIIFEFVIYHKTGNDVVEMSCGFCRLPVSDLLVNKKHTLQIEGGSPLNSKEIEKKNTVKKISFWNRNSRSKLWVYCKAYKNLNQNQRLHMDYLPENCLLPLKLLHFGSAFRHYLADVMLNQDPLHELTLGNPVIQVFMKILNCPDIVEHFTSKWEELVVRKLNSKQLMPGEVLTNRMVEMVERVYMAIYMSEFKYNDANPTDSCYTFKENNEIVFKNRGDLIQSAMTQHNVIGRQKTKAQKYDLRSEIKFKPFTVDELVFDPLEGVGMQKLVQQQWKDRRIENQRSGMNKSRGASPFQENRNNNIELPDAPSNIIDNVFGNLMKNVNAPAAAAAAPSDDRAGAKNQRLKVPQ